MKSDLVPLRNDAQGAARAESFAAGGDAHVIVAETVSALVVIDESGAVRFVNPAAETLFGRPAASLLGTPFGYPVTLVYPVDLEILRPDGSVSIVEMRSGPIRWRGQPAQLVDLRDITPRKQAELMLLQSQQILRAALDHLAAAIVILDQEGAVIAANHAWTTFQQQMHPPAFQAHIGRNYLELCKAAEPYHPQAGAMARGIEAVLRAERRHYALEYVVERPTGRRWFTIQVSACGDGWARAVLSHEEITGKKWEETLEADKRLILELMARQHSLEAVVAPLLAMAGDRYPDLTYGALSLPGAGVFHAQGVDLAPWQTAELDRWAVAVLAGRSPSYGAAPVIHVARPGDTELGEQPEPAALAGTAVCWQAIFDAGSYGGAGQLFLCRRAASDPTEDDLAFVELIGQLLAIAVEQHERTRLLAHQAHHDALTGLPNRLLFEDRLRQAIEVARRSGRMVAVLFIDLDRFKQINDTLGHAAGDVLLVQLARRFECCVRTSDTLARRGGDEFMLVLPEVTSSQQVTRVARRLHELLRLPFTIAGNELFVSASVGASLFPADGEDADALQRCADAAMYRAKSTLRNSFQFFDATMNRDALERLRLEAHLRRAVERDELAVHYQPKVDRRGRIVGAEALLRWRHPELGLVSPARFIPMAEELGLIVAIGERCMVEVCRQVRQWLLEGLPPLRVAVNVSALQFAQPEYIPSLTQILAQSELDPARIELELTESMLMGDVEMIARQLGELRDLRLTLAIDDFGTGFSSMSYLQRLPINVLKIDRSFVSRLGQPGDASDRGIVSAIITLGHQLGMELVAEGVETEEQYSLLYELGCDYFQGYYFSAPLPGDGFEHLLREEARGG